MRNIRVQRKQPLAPKISAFVSLICLAVASTACLPSLSAITEDPLESEAEASGGLVVTVSAAGLLAETLSVPPETLRVTLTKPRSTSSSAPALRRESPFANGTGTVEFRQIETGLWTVTAEIVDPGGVPVYGGSSEVFVRDGQTTTAQLTVTPLPGQLDIQIDLGGQCIEVNEEGACLADLVELGSVKFLPTKSMQPSTRSFTWPEGARDAVITAENIPAGDIEYQLVFYKDSRTHAGTLYASEWYPVRINPGRTTSVNWKPTYGSVIVEVHLQNPPPPPAGLTGQWTGEGLLLTWTASDGPDVSHYHLWHKTGPTEQMRKVYTAEAGESLSWLHESVSGEQCSASNTAGLYYFVTAVSEHGLESLRSDQIDACALL